MSYRPGKKLLEEVEKRISHYPEKRSASLMILHAVQEKDGYISEEAVEWVAKKLDLQPINIHELLTFYPMFRQEEPGKYVIKVCRTLSCALGGSGDLYKNLCKKRNSLPKRKRRQKEKLEKSLLRKRRRMKKPKSKMMFSNLTRMMMTYSD